MAHDYIKSEVEIQTQTGRLGVQIIATLVGGVLLVCSIAAQWLFDHAFYSATLGLISAILLGAPLVIVAAKDLIHGHMHMNELVALAVLAAMAAGQYQEAGAIAFFMIISVLIENRTALGAQASIESLVRITPTRATKLMDDQEAEVDAGDLQPGDTVRVRPGDIIPADGHVISGASTVNQATITGESLPVDKGPGDEAFSGTLNLNGMLDITVSKAGPDTTLGRVKDLILQAEQTRIPIVRMIDHYAAWYTPTVLMLVGIVLFFTLRSDAANPWGRAIAMLVVACPCALILATPTAMVAGLSSAARLGVLVKSVVDLEAARNLTAMIFDKTGTLTTGQLRVTRLTPTRGTKGLDLIHTAASAAQHSKHPVAKAVADVARQAQLTLPQPTQFEEISGQGLRATIKGQSVFMGRSTWLLEDESGAGLSPHLVATLQKAQSSPQAQGLSQLFVVRDGQLLGWIGLEDNTRPEAAEAVDHLRRMGLKRLIIVTGDRESVAKRVASGMHTEYRAGVLPQQKLEIVDQLKQAGHRVAVVGDGVNDAPALAAGDISIAMGAAGSDVAIHSATIALMNNNLNRIPFLIDLSRRTSVVIKQNLIFGVSFIAVFMALSAANYITPILAAAMHTVSSLIVVFNSARLVRVGEDLEHAEADQAREVSTTTRSAPTPTTTSPTMTITPATP